MLADLVILDRDPVDDLAGARVVDTYLNGQSVFAHPTTQARSDVRRYIP
jgi:hypothetical protein